MLTFKKEWFVFPVCPKKKNPLIKDNLNAASNDPDVISFWEETFPNCNWGLSLAKSGLVAVDVDTSHGGMEFWKALITQNSDPDFTLMAKTPSGGLHYIFKAREGVKYRGKIIRGIDVKFNGFTVIEPSKNEKGAYTWINENEIAAYPEWLESLIEKRFEKSKDVAFAPTASTSFLKKCVDILKLKELSYEEWVNAGMAIHSASPDENGLALFLDLTHGQSFKDGDDEKAQDKWNGFSNDGGITVKTLSHLIREKGLNPPRITEAEDLEALKQANIKTLLNEKMNSKGFELLDGTYICYHKDQVVDFFNSNGFAFSKASPNTSYIKILEDEEGFKNVRAMDVRSLMEATAPYKYAEVDFQSGARRLRPAWEIWRENVDRKTIDEIVFHPNKKYGERILNLWPGLRFEGNTIQGSPDYILEMINVSLCDGDDKKVKWLLDWLAHIIQRPEQKPTTVPVITGPQGTGKGILTDLVLARMLKSLYVKVSTSEELTSKFNLHLSGKLVTHIDEATWRGNKTEDGILKNIIGSNILSIEEKFGARYTIDNFSRYVISSNNAEAVGIEQGNRRYVFIETSDKWAAKADKFAPVLEAIQVGNEVEKFFNFLKARDISRFNPYMILEGNTAGAIAKIATGGIVAEFWKDVLFENPRRITTKKGVARSVVMNEFIKFSKESTTYEKNLTPKNFWHRTRSFLPRLNLDNIIIGRLFGEFERFHPEDLTNLRKTFCKSMEIPFEEVPFSDAEYLIKEGPSANPFLELPPLDKAIEKDFLQ